MRQRGGAETAMVTGAWVARCGRERARADKARAPGVWHGQRRKEQACAKRKRTGKNWFSKGAEANSPWMIFESVLVKDGLLDAAASRP